MTECLEPAKTCDRRVEPLLMSKTRFHHGLGRGHLRRQEDSPDLHRVGSEDRHGRLSPSPE